MRLGSVRPAQGFTLIWVLALLAIAGAGLAVIGPPWAEQMRREREEELLRIGALYAVALADYRAAAPGTLKQFPASLGDLLEDPRFPGTVRHLRRLYADPLDPTRPWGVVQAPGGGVMGVFSQSDERPLRQAIVDLGWVQLPAAARYQDWKFVAKEASAR